MLFDSLITANTYIRKTSFGESGKDVSVQLSDNESAIFFSIDPKSNANSEIRKLLSHKGQICDLIIYYRNSSKRIHLLCFVEVEGKDVKDAVEQIKATYSLFKDSINEFNKNLCNVNSFKNLIPCSYIRFGGKAPINYKHLKDELLQLFDGRCDIQKDSNVGKFLRKIN